MKLYEPADNDARAAELVEHIETFVRAIIADDGDAHTNYDPLKVARDNLTSLLAINLRRQ